MKILTDLAPLAANRRPATAKELAAVDRAIGRTPADLRTLYEFSGNLDRVAAKDGLEWLAAKDAVACWKMNRKITDAFPPHLLPIATDGAGNFACYDGKTRRIVDWDHETRKIAALAPSLEAFASKELLGPMRRQAKENAALGSSKKIAAGAAPVGLPSKIAQEPSPILSKVDRPGYGGGVQSVVFLADDRLLVSFSQLGAMLKLGAKTETHVRRGGIAAVEPGGKSVFCAEFGEIARLDAATCEALGRWQVEPLGRVVDVAIARDGTAATTDAAGTLLVWKLAKLGKGSTGENAASYDLPKARPLASLGGHEDQVFCAFSSNGALASGDGKGRVCIWKGRNPVASTRVADDQIRGVSFAPDGERLFVGLASGVVEVRDLRLKRLARWKTPGDMVFHLRVLSSGAVATIGEKLLRLWDPSTGKPLAKIARKRAQVSGRICDERGALLATAGPAALYRMS